MKNIYDIIMVSQQENTLNSKNEQELLKKTTKPNAAVGLELRVLT